MSEFFVKKSNLILTFLSAAFVVGYIVFSSLTTSLDFEMDRLSKHQRSAAEEHDLLLADAVKARSRSALLAAKDSLGLVDVVLAEGYVEVSPQVGGLVEGIALRP